jgi:hypothetical protein
MLQSLAEYPGIPETGMAMNKSTPMVCFWPAWKRQAVKRNYGFCAAGLRLPCRAVAALRSGNRRFEYEISREAGGRSGGEEYRLIAAETIDGHCFVYGQIKQSEHGDLKFELWKIAQGISFHKPEWRG